MARWTARTSQMSVVAPRTAAVSVTLSVPPVIGVSTRHGSVMETMTAMTAVMNKTVSIVAKL